MDSHYTDIVLLVDASSSMSHAKGAMATAVNAFIEEQRLVEDGFRCTITETFFDHAAIEGSYQRYAYTNSEGVGVGCVLETTPELDCADLWDFPELTEDNFPARGSTPFYDAVAAVIRETAERQALLPEGERPSQTVFVVVSDGEDNDSCHEDASSVEGAIQAAKDCGWQFVYLGIAQEGLSYYEKMLTKQAKDIGIDDLVVVNFSHDRFASNSRASKNSIAAAVARIGRNVAHYRVTGAGGGALAGGAR